MNLEGWLDPVSQLPRYGEPSPQRPWVQRFENVFLSGTLPADAQLAREGESFELARVSVTGPGSFRLGLRFGDHLKVKFAPGHDLERLWAGVQRVSLAVDLEASSDGSKVATLRRIFWTDPPIAL